MPFNVLIVDDEPAYCNLISRALQSFNFSVDTCTDPEEATERLMAGRIDLLVTDLHMPGFTGYDLAELAKRLPRAPKILVVTAQKALLEDAPKRLRDTQCLLKPFTLSDLRAKIGMLTGAWVESDETAAAPSLHA